MAPLLLHTCVVLCLQLLYIVETTTYMTYKSIKADKTKARDQDATDSRTGQCYLGQSAQIAHRNTRCPKWCPLSWMGSPSARRRRLWIDCASKLPTIVNARLRSHDVTKSVCRSIAPLVEGLGRPCR